MPPGTTREAVSAVEASLLEVWLCMRTAIDNHFWALGVDRVHHASLMCPALEHVRYLIEIRALWNHFPFICLQKKPFRARMLMALLNPATPI